MRSQSNVGVMPVGHAVTDVYTDINVVKILYRYK